LSEQEKAIVKAKAQGNLEFDAVAAALNLAFLSTEPLDGKRRAQCFKQK